MAKTGAAVSAREAVSCPRSGARGSKAAVHGYEKNSHQRRRTPTKGDGKEARCGADVVVRSADGLSPSDIRHIVMNGGS